MKSINVAKKSAPIILDDTRVQVTKEFAKNARIYGSSEYKMWLEIKKDLPDAKMVTKSIKRNPSKTVDTRNMKYENMALYIRTQDNATELMVTFEKTIMQSRVQNNPYRYVLAWFLKQFPNADEYKNFFETRAAEAKQQNNIFAVGMSDAEFEDDFDEAANY